MSEQQLRQYVPGDEIEVLVQVHHVPKHLSGVSARFVLEGEERAIVNYVYMSGEQRVNAEARPYGMLPDVTASEVRMAATVEPEHAPGVYRLHRVTVTTYGGKEHRYRGEELGGMTSLGFKIVEEPDDKPELLMTIAPD